MGGTRRQRHHDCAIGFIDGDLAHSQIAMSERAGLVKNHGIDLCKPLERASILERDAVLEQALRRGDLNHGYGETKRSEEHTSELQSLMRISYAVFCLKTKKT